MPLPPETAMDDLYSYTDYRLFLRDYYEFHKAKNPAFSYRYLAGRAGVNSSAFFKFIIEGKRNLTKQSIIKIAAALRLTDNECEYFENLVFFNQAKTIREKDLFFSRLMQHKKARKAAPIGEEYYEYFAQWYHCVVRELIVMVDIADDWERLGRLLRPRIGAKQAKQSVDLLLRLGFLKKENGRYIQTEPVLSTGYSIRAHQVIKFQVEMLKNAIESFTVASERERLNSSTTFGISEELFAHYVAMIRDFRLKLMELASLDKKASRVYQLTLNLFPVSERVNDPGEAP
jgi:uncharacterized protein (TIGR02147 family)